MTSESKERAGIQSVEVGFSLLQALGQAPGPLMLRDLARAAGMSAAKAHRYLVSFQRLQLVVQDAAGAPATTSVRPHSSWGWPRWRGWTPSSWRASASSASPRASATPWHWRSGATMAPPSCTGKSRRMP